MHIAYRNGCKTELNAQVAATLYHLHKVNEIVTNIFRNKLIIYTTLFSISSINKFMHDL